MTTPPAFSSFPLTTESNHQASTSRASPPTFESFPDLPAHRPLHGSKQSSRSIEQQLRGPEHSYRSSYSRKQAGDGEDSNDRPKKQRTNGEASSDERRRRKEERRDRERLQAENLVRGKTERERGPDRGDHSRPSEDVRWYETTPTPDVLRALESGLPSENTFFEDVVGDRDARKYGQSSYNIPKYNRGGRGCIVGLSAGIRTVQGEERNFRGIEVAPLGRSHVSRYSSKVMDSVHDDRDRRVILRPNTATHIPLTSDFTPFSSSSQKNMDTSLPAYRSITVEDDAEEEDDIANDAPGELQPGEDDMRKKTAETERHLQQNPSDVDEWIRYSMSHRKALPDDRHPLTTTDSSRQPTTRAAAEITLSILSRALEASPANHKSVRLHIAYLKAAEAFWPPARVSSRWQNVLDQLSGKDGPNTAENIMPLWLGYIDWREGQGFGEMSGERPFKSGAGGLDEIVDVYSGCLSQLNTFQQESVDQRQSREENQLYLFLRLCLLLRQAGYRERALAAFQAIMDVTFYKPDNVRIRPDQASLTWFKSVLQAYEVFWESEKPRFGETGSLGWRNQIQDATPSPTMPSESESQMVDPFERWREAEQRAEQEGARPARTTDLDTIDDEDPYRVILFADVKPFLFPVLSPDVRLQLIYAYLNFLGLNLSPPGISSTSPAADDGRLWWSLASNDRLLSQFWPKKPKSRNFAWQIIGGEAMEPERNWNLSEPFSCPIKCQASDRCTLFAAGGCWSPDMSLDDLSQVDISMVQSALSVLQTQMSDSLLNLTALAIDAVTSTKSAIKSAKRLLSSDRENLVLWEAYARLERQRGNVAAARTVYKTALEAAIAARADGHLTLEEMDLWASWAEMEFEAGDEHQSFRVILMIAGVGDMDATDADIKTSVVGQLRAQRPAQSTSDLFILSLYRYHTLGVIAARDLVREQIALMPAGGCEVEEAYQLLVRLIYLHAKRHPSPASLLRDVLESAIDLFPNNTTFLSLYLWGETGGRVYGRIQRLTSKLAADSQSGPGVVGYLWSVWAEGVLASRTFWNEDGTGAERVRLILDRGVNSTTGKYCAALWKLYIQFEAMMSRGSSAKQLCYRAVATLGGCKDLYLLPFSSQLRQHFLPRELKDWAQLMVERGIRIRIPFERYWNNEDEEDMGIVLPEDEVLEDDELAFLRDRQSMKPY